MAKLPADEEEDSETLEALNFVKRTHRAQGQAIQKLESSLKKTTRSREKALGSDKEGRPAGE